jgi:lipoate-protein ligase A
MAADEALLEVAEVNTVRLYRWSPATVSLGYFQDHALVTKQLPASMPIVRRITGGGAIWHEHEVTYCLSAIVGRDGFPMRMQAAYTLLHHAVLMGLRHAQKTLTMQPTSLGDRRYRDEPRCFASPAADDVVTDTGGKVLGSAGRQRGNRVLMHGSLKLASNPWDGDTVAGCQLDFNAAADVLLTALGSALGQTTIVGEWTAAELAARQRIHNERYATDAWVVHRQGPRP